MLYVKKTNMNLIKSVQRESLVYRQMNIDIVFKTFDQSTLLVETFITVKLL